MGYSQHELKDDTNNYELIEALREECEDAKYALSETGDCEESWKWYEHDQNLRAFSKKHPEVLFTLRGEGEESGDVWVEYYKGGRMQRCSAIITFKPYDPSLLT